MVYERLAAVARLRRSSCCEKQEGPDRPAQYHILYTSTNKLARLRSHIKEANGWELSEKRVKMWGPPRRPSTGETAGRLPRALRGLKGLQGLQATPARTLRPGLGGSPSDPRHAATLASRPSSRAMGRRRQAWPCLAERSYLYNNSNNLH